jgi:hypothetical protein
VDEHSYQPPPPTAPPPPSWRPARIVPPVPPRELPQTDHEAVDAEEQRARMVTRGVLAATLLALAVLLVILHGRFG